MDSINCRGANPNRLHDVALSLYSEEDYRGKLQNYSETLARVGVNDINTLSIRRAARLSIART